MNGAISTAAVSISLRLLLRITARSSTQRKKKPTGIITLPVGSAIWPLSLLHLALQVVAHLRGGVGRVHVAIHGGHDVVAGGVVDRGGNAGQRRHRIEHG